MDIPGFTLLLQDFCEYCPEFEAEVESEDISCFHDGAPRSYHHIRCVNRRRCARIAANIGEQVKKHGG